MNKADYTIDSLVNVYELAKKDKPRSLIDIGCYNVSFFMNIEWKDTRLKTMFHYKTPRRYNDIIFGETFDYLDDLIFFNKFGFVTTSSQPGSLPGELYKKIEYITGYVTKFMLSTIIQSLPHDIQCDVINDTAFYMVSSYGDHLGRPLDQEDIMRFMIGGANSRQCGYYIHCAMKNEIKELLSYSPTMSMNDIYLIHISDTNYSRRGYVFRTLKDILKK